MHKLVANAMLSVLLTVGTAAAVQAATLDVNLAGYRSVGEFGDPANSVSFFNIGAGSFVTGYDYVNLSFATQGSSWQSEFVLSVNNADGSEYLDWVPSEVDAGGTFGPASGSFDGPTGFGGGAPFRVTDGVIFVTTYELYDDPGVDATVTAGTLRIFYTPAAVPEPAAAALFSLGLLGIVGRAARRRTRGG